MHRPIVRAALAVLLLLTGPVLAHDPAPAHGCQAPVRPVDDQDDVRWRAYLDAVDGFRACISDFAIAHRAAARAHQDAANAATLDWNEFVRRELNVPEDYPWPPEPRR